MNIAQRGVCCGYCAIDSPHPTNRIHPIPTVRSSPLPPNTPQLPNTACGMAEISSLPDELLVQIVLHLPWHDRVLVECLNRHWQHLTRTRGWSNVRCYDCRDYFPNETESLLARVAATWSPSTSTSTTPPRPFNCAPTCAACSSPTSLDIRTTLLTAPNLRPLSTGCWRRAPDSLVVKARGDDGSALIRGLQLPPRLRALTVSHRGGRGMELVQGLLADANVTTIASVGVLRSLTLCAEATPLASLGYLSGFTHLVHLSIQPAEANLPRLTSALAHLGPGDA